ncbi:DeoR/GlpR family DNA-binding transcription regulator [Kluyvera cryocrescens]|uniref:DeoR/GlpR family DNA-binding transcription regulator n=1 Tax=Kluyvera cryocrescens TaxID=580 RepID=UPI0028BE9CA3|nr:DeoR/GlpR family DNA-binding transcription regulator [Kluyvera cryocrescens]WNN73922.1 DeoR/GlpR family DNA-binding transcription regulator [Kluyvera cryocrescens]
MLASQRKQHILEILARDKQVHSTELSQRFSVSEDSIRRDLRELAAAGLLQRVHGGALPVSAAIAPFETRKTVQIDAKRSVAQKAAALIGPGQVVIIDGGTTTTEMIKLLPQEMPFTVVTHSPNIAVGLIDYPAIEVILLGGTLFKHSVVTMGTAMTEAAHRINADLYFMGITGVHHSAGFTTGSFEEAGVKRLLSLRASETIVMASQEKINAASAFAIGDLSLASTLVVESELDKPLAEALARHRVSVIF